VYCYNNEYTMIHSIIIIIIIIVIVSVYKEWFYDNTGFCNQVLKFYDIICVPLALQLIHIDQFVNLMIYNYYSPINTVY
jgi:hypothetical protein